MDEIERRPTVITDDEFPQELAHLSEDIDDFYNKVRNATGDHSIFQQVQNIQDRQKDISRTLEEIDENLHVIRDKTGDVEMNLDHIDENVDDAESRLVGLSEIDIYSV